ncbi:hypothetical protein [Microbacterium thalli]|uniref:Uncharacterized protein n=1 Tax=Microbacterium thalli TaxID=3027921 RepID=A0ABT5SFH9_9MICO|nr:hypothetical protein [Microbacterium thalli]MDD7960991.1 hypothetical protein [Microbacterium thalli]
MSDPNDPFADFEPYEPPQKPERAKREKREKPPREKREKPERQPRPPREPRTKAAPVMADWPDEPREPRPPRAPRDNERGDRRTLVILSAIAAALVVAVIVVLVIYLTQSQQEPTADPVPTAPATQAIPQQTGAPQAPSPSETAEAATSGLSVTADGFTITDAAGATVFTHVWADDAGPAIAALTELFGQAPTEDFQNGDAENYAYNIYVWEGFRLYDVFLNESNRPRSEVPAPTFVSFDSDIDVPVTDDFGVELDMSADEVAALGPDSGQGGRFVFGSDRNTFYQDGQRRFGASVTVEGTRVSVTYTFRAG